MRVLTEVISGQQVDVNIRQGSYIIVGYINDVITLIYTLYRLHRTIAWSRVV